MAKELKSELAAAGITLVPRPRSAADFLSTLNMNTQQMFLMIWVADYPLADWFLAPLFSANSPDNHSGYHDPSVQSLIDAERSNGDPVPRRKLVFNIEVTDESSRHGPGLAQRRTFTNWRQIGALTFDNAVVSYNGDFVIHFNHPTWRSDRNNPTTATRANERKVH